MKISDIEIEAALDAWFGNDDYMNDAFSEDMRRAIKSAIKVRKRLKRERKSLKRGWS